MAASRFLFAWLLALVLCGPCRPADRPEHVSKSSATRFNRMPAESVRIDEELAAGWKKQNLKPSRPTTDDEFIRRATLDIVGRIAKPGEIRKFQSDPAARRRAMLIERLLDSPEYAKNWASIWTVWLMTRSGPEVYHDELRGWLEVQMSRSDCSYERLVSDLLTASGRNDQNGAVNFLLANLGEPLARGKEVEEGQYTMVPATSRTVRLFLGVRIQCTQCHDDLLHEEWKQEQFWGINAFFRQIERVGPKPMKGRNPPAPELELRDNLTWNRDRLVLYEKRNAVVLPARPVFLDGNRPSMGSRARREQLAALIVHDDRFAKAYVNRMWAHFFGRGLNAPAPADDLSEATPVNYPELLDYLATQFKQRGYNPRALVQWICNSQAYQLSTVANATNSHPDAEPYFSRMALKTMSPEQLFESLMVVTQLGETETDIKRSKMREAWMRNLLVNFGDDEGNEVTFNGTVVQALLLMNGQELNAALANRQESPIISALTRPGANSRTVMDDLFIRVLNRHPTGSELIEIPRKLNLRANEPSLLAPWQDLTWALVNSNEFILNH